jgi:hypothetical protein
MGATEPNVYDHYPILLSDLSSMALSLEPYLIILPIAYSHRTQAFLHTNFFQMLLSLKDLPSVFICLPGELVAES